MKKLLPLFTVLLLFGCKDNKDKPDYIDLVHSDINASEFEGRGGDIISFDFGLIGIEESRSLPPFFIFRKDGNKFEYTTFGNRGQGPEDFIHPHPIQYLSEDVFGVYDRFLKVYREISVPGNNGSISIQKSINIEQRPFRVIKVAFNQYLGLSDQDGLLTLMNDSGKVINTFFEYPYKDAREQAIANTFRASAYQGFLVTTPGKTKCVYASLFSEIIHFYDIQNGQVSLIKKIETTYSQYKAETIDGYPTATMGKDGAMGYISVTASDKYVYALYCGKTMEEMTEKNDISMVAREVRVFDWSGELVKTYQLDVDCKHINVSSNDDILWGMALMPEATPVYFDLPGNSAGNKQVTSNKPISNSYMNSTPGKEERGTTLLAINEDGEVIATYDSDNPIEVEVGKIQVGVEAKITTDIHMQNQRVESVSPISAGIILKDSVTPDGQPTTSLYVKKQKPGKFNDTITLVYEEFDLVFVLSGEAY